MRSDHSKMTGWQNILTGIAQVLSILWSLAVVAFDSAMTGADSGSGLMGAAPSEADKTGSSIGKLIVLVLVIATAFSWRKRFLIRFGVSVIGLISLHAVVFGIYG